MTQQGNVNASAQTKTPSRETMQILERIASYLPENFAQLDSKGQIEQLLLASSFVINPEGDWVLVDASLPLKSFLVGN